MFVDKYSSPSKLMTEISGTDIVGVCGIGTQTCYDVAVLEGPTPMRATEKLQLFRELPKDHPDYHEDLTQLAKEMNKAFREKAADLLKEFAREHPKIKGVHMAAIGSSEGLYLAYATKLPPDELLRRGANLAKGRLNAFLDELMTPTFSSAPKGK